MTAALGINQTWLFTSVLFLGSLLAGLGGALQIPREAVNLHMDINIVVEAFVVVVVGGMGSVGGAFLAAVLIGQLQAFGILIFPQITLVIVFLFMAVVLVVRPHGLLGRPQALARVAGTRAGTAAEVRHPGGTAGGYGPAGGPGAASGGGRRLCADGPDRNPDPDAVRRQPAFHHGSGGHDLVRSCRLFRAGSLWRGAAGEALRGGHAAGAGGGAAAGWRWSAAVRLVLRSAVGRLPCHADAGLRADHVVGGVPVAGRDGGRQRDIWASGPTAGRRRAGSSTT